MDIRSPRTSLDGGNTSARLTRAAYSEENYRKLVALKDKYDPVNVFRFNHNIAPSVTSAWRGVLP